MADATCPKGGAHDWEYAGPYARCKKCGQTEDT